MSDEKQVDPGRRGLLVATCAAGGVAGLAAAGAFVSTFEPSERAKAAGAPVEVDIADLKPGEMKTVDPSKYSYKSYERRISFSNSSLSKNR